MPHSRAAFRFSLLTAALVGTLSCEESGGGLSEPTTGTLEVTTATTGVETDPDGYTVQLDSDSPQAIGLAATWQSGNLAEGSHTIALSGVASNCAVEGENPRTVSITAGETTTVTFAITCGATAGNLRVTAATAGPSPDIDGYTLLLDGADRGTIGPTAETTLEGLTAGTHSIGLSGVAGNCLVEGENLRAVTVTAGGTATADFIVTCQIPPASTGTIHITTTTSGGGIDPDGYQLQIDGSGTQPIASNGEATVGNVAVGAHSVQLAGVAGHCTVAGTNPQSVSVTAGGTAEVAFSVTCQTPPASTGSIHISITTSGGGTDPDGYQFQIDGSGSQPIASSGEATVGNVALGAHSVLLAGVAGHCAVAGTNPQSVSVPAGGTAEVAFSVTCQTTPTGSIEVRTTTTGSGLDPDGYTFTVASGAPQSIGANATVSSGSLAPGNYSVQLAGVAGNCTLEGTNPRSVSVTANNTTQVAFAITCAAVANTWQTKAPMPEPLWAHAAGVIPASNGDQIIYVVGGYTGNAAIRVPNVYAYNTRTDTWSKSASLPFGRAETNGAVPIGGKLYVSGGIGDGVGHLNDLSVYTPSTNTWVQKRPMPNRVYQGSSAAMGGKLYVLHGFCDDCATVVSEQLWRYDPATDRWTRMRDAPRPHVSAASGVINGKWYVAGGGNGGQRLDMYDPKTNTWTEKATMPAGHWGGAGAVLGQKLYVIGGYDPSTLQSMNTVHAYDPATNTWATRASMPTPRSTLVAVKAVRDGNSVLYALGGGGPPTTVNEEYDD